MINKWNTGILSVLVLGTMVGCFADEKFGLNNHQKIYVKITSAHGIEDITCEKVK